MGEILYLATFIFWIITKPLPWKGITFYQTELHYKKKVYKWSLWGIKFSLRGIPFSYNMSPKVLQQNTILVFVIFSWFHSLEIWYCHLIFFLQSILSFSQAIWMLSWSNVNDVFLSALKSSLCCNIVCTELEIWY